MLNLFPVFGDVRCHEKCRRILQVIICYTAATIIFMNTINENPALHTLVILNRTRTC